MIYKYGIECPGCHATILLRLGVGHDKEQPFYLICSKCGAPIRAKQVILIEPTPDAHLVLEDAKEVPVPDNVDHVITVHPDLPSLPSADAMTSRGGSPFLMTHQLLGERFEEWHRRDAAFRQLADKLVPDIRRWITYYLDRRWGDFDNTGQRIHGEDWPFPQVEWQRHDVIHKTLDWFFAPLFIKPAYPEMKERWYETLASSSDTPGLLEYAKSVMASERLSTLQMELFHCLEQFLANRASLLPALPAVMYPKGSHAAIEELRLFRDDFPALRDLYIATFESCHRTLPYVLAFVNLSARGRADAFGEKCSSVEAFDKLPNAKKTPFLAAIPSWSDHWGDLFDRQLRNAIGHHSARHDLSSGRLIVDGDGSRPYLQFVMQTMRLIDGLLACLAVVKTFYVMPFLLDSGASNARTTAANAQSGKDGP